MITSLFMLGLIGMAGLGLAAYFGLTQINARGPHSASAIVVIERGETSRAIANKLASKGVISSPGLFRLAERIYRPWRGSLKAGEYEIPAGATMNQIMAMIQAGKGVVHKLTIPEGWTTAQVLERIRTHKALAGQITDTPAEGSLLPDTYIFRRGDSRNGLIRRMQKAQQHLLDELWPQRAKGLPIKTRKDAIILASIIEKETGIKSERSRVAAVFINRLKRGMRLQSDPTTIYGITLGRKALDRPLTRKDINTKTSYNTYQIDGLPPGPIANPGRAAIKAALNPEPTDDLYFVADGSGGHAFSSNLAGHNKNVKAWRMIVRRKRAAEKAKANNTGSIAPAPANSDAEKQPATAQCSQMAAT